MLDKINQDLKTAMLGGDKRLVEVLKSLKTAVQYAKVALGEDLSEDAIVTVFQKEQKKRQDALDLYMKAGDKDRSEQELYEKEVIARYLPVQLSEQEIEQLVDKAMSEFDEPSMKNMGQIIGLVKKFSGPAADGSTISRIVRGKLS